MDQQQEKSKTVPYLSASKMAKLLELISERSLSHVPPSYFQTYGFGQADAYLAVNTLKFLGLIDDNEKVMEILRKFQLTGDERNKEAAAVIRKAYKKLFDTTEKPYDLSKDDLANEFMHNYGITKRIAKSAVPAFLKLCEFAGLKEKGSVLMRKRTIKSENAKTPKNEKLSSKQEIGQESIGEYTPIPFADGAMKLFLPTEILIKTSFDGDLDKDWKSLVKTLTEFAKKYLVKNNIDAGAK